MTKDIIIVGASGFGRELTQYIEDINEAGASWNIRGFIDDNPDALKGVEHEYKIIDNIQHHTVDENAYYVCALAFPKVKEKIVGMLKERGAKFAAIIHPTARVSRYATIGEGVVVTPGSNINIDAHISDFVSILGSGVGHDAEIGPYSTLSGRVSVNGHVKVGANVYVGCGAMIAPGKRIGDGAVIGMGSVVISNVRAGVTVFGNPAKKMEI